MKKLSIATPFFLSLVLIFVSCGPSTFHESGKIKKKSYLNSSYSEFEAIENHCGLWTDRQSQNQIHYCIKIGNNPSGRPLYVFHGMGGNEVAICEKMVSDPQALKSAGYISHMICPSFGSQWVIHKNGREASFKRFQSFIQEEYLNGVEQIPILYGQSMGGFNALKISGFRNPSEKRFHKVVAACPAIFSDRLDRFIGWTSELLANYLLASTFHGLDPKTSIAIIQNSPYFDRDFNYPDLLLMPNQQDPVGIIHQSFSIFGQIHLSGIYRGALNFYHELLNRHQSVEIQELPGGHCAEIPMQKVFQFLGR